jgi:hypothetical protein
VRKITGHRSRELERYQHFSPVFRAQTVDLIAQVLLSDTVALGEREKKETRPEVGVPKVKFGGVDGTRTRDLRRDRRKRLGELINDLLRLVKKFRRHAATRGDTKRPV